jgi:hypothetical protein
VSLGWPCQEFFELNWCYHELHQWAVSNATNGVVLVDIAEEDDLPL